MIEKFPKQTFYEQKIMMAVLWSAIGIVHYSFLESNQSITTEV